MVWDTNALNVVVKALGTVESNMNYGAVSVADPISIGAFQWYGVRAAALLFKIKADATLSYNAYCPATIKADINAHAATDSWWNDRIITKDEHNALYTLLTQTDVIAIQITQVKIDITAYKGTAARWGLDQDFETQTVQFFCTVYHQSPNAASQIVNSLPTKSTLEDIYAATLNNSIVGPYKSRQETCYNIIKNADQTDIDVTVGTPPPVEDGFDGNEPSPNGVTNSGGNGHKLAGTDHHMVDKGHLRLLYTSNGIVKFYKSGGVWLAEENKHVGSYYPNGGEDPVVNNNPAGLDWDFSILKVYAANVVTSANVKVTTLTEDVPEDATIICLCYSGGGFAATTASDSKGNVYTKPFGALVASVGGVLSVLAAPVKTALVAGNNVTVNFSGTSQVNAIILVVTGLDNDDLDNLGKFDDGPTSTGDLFLGIAAGDTTGFKTFQIAVQAGGANITDAVQTTKHYLPYTDGWTYRNLGLTNPRINFSTRTKDVPGPLSANIGAPAGNADRGVFAFNIRHVVASPPNTTPPLPGTPVPPVPGGGGPVATRIVNYAKSKLGHYSYSQGPGRMNPEVSGYCDCSSFIIFCYQTAGNVSLGGATYTGNLCTKGTLIKEGAPTLGQMALGDLIFLRWGPSVRSNSPFDHVEMYSGGGQRISMGHTPGPNQLAWDVDINSALSNGGRVQIRRCL